MGFNIACMLMIMKERSGTPFSGSVVQIGRQDIYFDWDTMKLCAQHINYPLQEPDEIGYRYNEWVPDKRTLDDVTFFKALGFSEVYSLDASDYECPTFVHDLNRPIPDSLKNSFDAVVDGGSFEHIFHLPNALQNVVSMLKVGGRIIHHSPTHNYVDHGFYSFSPTWFHDYYEANHFTDCACNLVGMKLPFRQNDVPKVFPYTPGGLEEFSVGGFTKDKFHGCEMFMTTFGATKTEQSVGDVVPMQRRYREWWQKPVAEKQGAAKAVLAKV